MNGLPKKYCEECQSMTEFNHCYFNSGYDTKEDYCKNMCVCSGRHIKLFGKRDCNRIKRKLGLTE